MTYKTLYLCGMLFCFVGCSACMLRVASVNQVPVHDDPIVLSDAQYISDSLNDVALYDYSRSDSMSNNF